jgi:hypothetical protein
MPIMVISSVMMSWSSALFLATVYIPRLTKYLSRSPNLTGVIDEVLIDAVLH